MGGDVVQAPFNFSRCGWSVGVEPTIHSPARAAEKSLGFNLAVSREACVSYDHLLPDGVLSPTSDYGDQSLWLFFFAVAKLYILGDAYDLPF